MQLALRLVVCGVVALAVRAAAGQVYGPSPGERGDPYSPIRPPAQVQQRYPLPAASPPPNQPAPPPIAERYPLPQPAPASGQPQPQPQSQQASYAPREQPAPATAQPPIGELFQPTQTVAIVGDQHVFYGEVSPIVEQILALMVAGTTKPPPAEELELARQGLTRQFVAQIVNSKLAYLDFERQLEKGAGRDKLPEVRKSVATQMQSNFERELPEVRKQIATAPADQFQKLLARDFVLPRLAMLMKQNSCETMGELDNVLRRYGSTLDKEIRLYGEHRAGRSTIQKHVNIKPEITHQEMLDYYRTNAAEFAVAAKARFEILTVKFANFPSTDAGRREAWDRLAQMGNAVYFGTPLAAVAKNHSQEPNAEKGGYYDWTTQGSLASKPIDAAVFTLEPGKLSRIIEDERGYHIVRVIERTEAGQVSFLEAQPGIKKALIAQKLDADYREYVEMLRTSTRVWTIYDEQQPAVAGQPAVTERR